MNTFETKTAKINYTSFSNRALVVCLLLVVAFVVTTVSNARADLPPEVYYQGNDTGVNGDDDGTGALPIGFDFTFYGNTYSQFYATSNGMITFSDYRQQAGWGDWPHYINKSIPNENWPNNYIAPFWDDTTAYNNLFQRVLYQTIGTAPNRMLVVQYTNVGFYEDPTPLGTFFVILYEGSNNIQFQYRYLIGDNVRAHGDSATVGIESSNGKAGTQYSFNTVSLASEQVILFTPNGSNAYTISTDSYEPVLLGLGTSPAPDIPIQTTPLKGSTVSTTPTFSWGAAENATNYEIRVDNNPNMGSLEIHETGLTETSFTPDTPLAAGTYYWIVIAHNENDQAWSQQWNFTASVTPPQPLPGVPLLVAPNQDETDVAATPTFSWQTASNADEYQLIVSEQADLSAPLLDQAGILTTTFEAAGLMADTLYYWTVIASNETGSTQSSVRSFTSFHINVGPTAVADTPTLAEDSSTTTFDVLANDSDPENDVLSIVSVSTTSDGGTAVLNNNQIEYTPAANFFGTETFSYTISDGELTDSAVITVTVTSVNDLPIANDDNASVGENNGTIQLNVLANDSDPDADDTLSLLSVGTPDNGGTAVINGSLIDYTPAADFAGIETFTYTITDGQGGTAEATVTINLQADASNSAPQAQDDTPETLEDSTLVIYVLSNDSDPENDSLSILNISTPAHGTAVVQGNTIRYKPNANFYGYDSFTYTISDGEFTDSATVNITIVSVNDLPQANQDTSATMAGQPVTIHVLANDHDMVEGSSLTVTAVHTPAHGSATTNGTTITYTPNTGFTGTETFTYTLSDGTDSVTGTITVTVTPYQIFLPLVIK